MLTRASGTRRRFQLAVVLVVTISFALAAVPPAGATIASIHFLAGGGVGDGGLPTDALTYALGILRAPTGDVFIREPNRIRRIDHSSGLISTVVGTGALTGTLSDGETGTATGMGSDAIDLVGTGTDGTLYLSQWAVGNEVFALGTNGVLHLRYTVSPPKPVTVAEDGTIYIARDAQVTVVHPGTSTAVPFAGTGVAGHSGEGGPATSAQIGSISSMTVAPDGTLYLADGFYIQHVDPSGNIHTIGGIGQYPTDLSGDGSDATLVRLDATSLSVDSAGRVYLLEPVGNISTIGVREIATNGKVLTTTADTQGQVGYSIGSDDTGVLVPHFQTALHCASDGSQNNVGCDTIAGTTEAQSPDGTQAADAFFGDTGYPFTTLRDANDRLLFTSVGSIRTISSGAISTVAGGGTPSDHYGDGLPGPQAETHAYQMALGPSGDVYFEDVRPLGGSSENRIRVLHTNGTVDTLAGGGNATWPAAEGQPATSVSLPDPAVQPVAVNGAGDIFYASTDGYIYKISGGTIVRFAGGGQTLLGPGTQTAPASSLFIDLEGLAASTNSDELFVANGGNTLLRIGADGVAHLVLAWPESGVSGLFAGTDGSVYFGGAVIWRLWPDGRMARVIDCGGHPGFGPPLATTSCPTGASLASDGSITFGANGVNAGIHNIHALWSADPYSPSFPATPSSFGASSSGGAVTLTVATPPVDQSVIVYGVEDGTALTTPTQGIPVVTIHHSATSTSMVTLYRWGSGPNAPAFNAGHTYAFSAFALTTPLVLTQDATQLAESYSSSYPATASVLATSDTTPPSHATNLSATGHGTITLNFTFPTDPDFDHVDVRYAPGMTPPVTEGDGTYIASRDLTSGSYSSVQVQVDAMSAYAFSVFSVDATGNVSSPATLLRPAPTLSATDPGPVEFINDTYDPSNGGRQTIDFVIPTNANVFSVRTAAGSTPPPTPTDGSSACLCQGTYPLTYIDTPTVGQTYSVSIFAWSLSNENHYSRTSLSFVAGQNHSYPDPVTSLNATTGVGTAHFSWIDPNPGAGGTHTVVREVAGITAPTSSSTGTVVYSGTGTSASVGSLAPGTSYSFSVANVLSTGTTSPIATVTLFGTSLQISGTTVVTDGNYASIYATLIRGRTALSARTINLYRHTGRSTWTFVAAATTNTSGVAKFLQKPSTNQVYRVTFAGSGFDLGRNSAQLNISVRPNVAVSISSSSITYGHSTAVYVIAAPNQYRHVVYLQSYYSGAWHTISSAALNSSSRATFTVKPSRGRYTYRVYDPATSVNIAGYSRLLGLSVS